MKVRCLFLFLVITLYFVCDLVVAGDTTKLGTEKTKEQLKFEETKEAEKARQTIDARVQNKQDINIELLNLPEDTSSRFTVQQLLIRGNSLIATEELFENMPLVYNASDKSAYKADPGDLYDLRALHGIIVNPSQPHEISRRAMQGFTQYILSAYQDKGYAGIYVYISAKAADGEAQLQNGVLPIDVIEAKVSEIAVTSYDAEGKKTEKGFLQSSNVKIWSPIKVGQIVKKKELDYFVNLLNLSPDRYVSAVVSRGSEPSTLDIRYEIHEANPWHYYIQADDSGTKERQWAPRIGVINTNLTGRDDKFTVALQSSLEEGPQDNYSIYGSYDVPLGSPRLRLKLFGGRSEFEVDGGGGIDFLGNGSFYGGELRYNAFQHDGWFFDLTGSLSHEKSKVTSSIPVIATAFGTVVEMDLWGVGFDIYRRGSMSDTSFVFNRLQSMGGSSRERFNTARTGAHPDFAIVTFSANHSQFLDTNKVQKLFGSFKYIRPDGRLIPAKMTTFGGMYTVRGYKESGIVADGGMLASLQYEYDLIRKEQVETAEAGQEQERTSGLKKLAPLVFCDLGRAEILDAVPGVRSVEELCSIGTGLIIEIGENFNAGIYYGWPLKSTVDTSRGSGNLNIGLMIKW